MNTRKVLHSCLVSLSLSLVAGDVAAAENPVTQSLGEAFSLGKISLQARARYEDVRQANLSDAHALTLRTRLGFTSAPWHGLKAMAELENIVAADGDAYSQSGLNPGGTGRAVVADPETTELNQFFVAYAAGENVVTLGRQKLVLDNARFVGDVGWRQNMQTFDAVVVQNKSVAQTVFTYAYLDRINRVFGDEHAQGKWSSASHLVNVSHQMGKWGTLVGYAYLLDFKNSAANSCATYGASFAGTRPLTKELKFSYRAELATQSDHGASTLDYRATYAALSAGVVAKAGTLSLGYESLGSDHNVGFKTPLATLHAFNGWADLFLATPAAGLVEFNLKATTALPANFSLVASVHRFETDATGLKLGDEFDFQCVKKFSTAVSGLVKYADFHPDGGAFPSVRKIWVQVEFSY